MKIPFESHQFLEVFQEFQTISGQDLVDTISDCYDGYFQELLIAIGKLDFIWWTADLAFHSTEWLWLDYLCMSGSLIEAFFSAQLFERS